MWNNNGNHKCVMLPLQWSWREFKTLCFLYEILATMPISTQLSISKWECCRSASSTDFLSSQRTKSANVWSSSNHSQWCPKSQTYCWSNYSFRLVSIKRINIVLTDEFLYKVAQHTIHSTIQGDLPPKSGLRRISYPFNNLSTVLFATDIPVFSEVLVGAGGDLFECDTKLTIY